MLSLSYTTSLNMESIFLQLLPNSYCKGNMIMPGKTSHHLFNKKKLLSRAQRNHKIVYRYAAIPCIKKSSLKRRGTREVPKN